MKHYEIISRLDEIEKEKFTLLKRLSELSYSNCQPGDKLADGCIVVDRRPKSIFYNERLLIAAPQETEVDCEWTPEFQPVFDKVNEHGFNPTDWFIPSVEQLQLAYKNAKPHFSGWWYWSSDEASSHSACGVIFNGGYQGPGIKTFMRCVRAFRLVEL
jgi:hypothetical protein